MPRLISLTPVRHRIDGLENKLLTQRQDIVVRHRIDGLEITAFYRIYPA